MARVDYFAIEEAIKALLIGNTNLVGVQIGLEEELPFTAAADPQVEIYLERRDAPSCSRWRPAPAHASSCGSRSGASASVSIRSRRRVMSAMI